MSGGCIFRRICVKQNLKTEANLVVSECAVYSLLKFYRIIFSFYFGGGKRGEREGREDKGNQG